MRARCPKCAGSLFQYRDRFGFYEQCLQCGFVRDIKEETAITGKYDLKPGIWPIKEFVQNRK